MIYVEQDLKSSMIEGLRGQGVLAWFGPVVCFSVLVGLSLDYDIFLLERVHEYRLMGFNDQVLRVWSEVAGRQGGREAGRQEEREAQRQAA